VHEFLTDSSKKKYIYENIPLVIVHARRQLLPKVISKDFPLLLFNFSQKEIEKYFVLKNLGIGSVCIS
jgi:hypothetical protein